MFYKAMKTEHDRTLTIREQVSSPTVY